MNAEQQQLIDFLKGTGKSFSGHTVNSITNANYLKLEFTHNYIQWAFPLREKSRYAPSVTLTDELIDVIKKDSVIQDNMLKMFSTMMNFYGFKWNGKTEGAQIEPNVSKTLMMASWLNPGNHNFKRITRIIGSICICVSPELGNAFYLSLLPVVENMFFCKRAVRYWKNATSWK